MAALEPSHIDFKCTRIVRKLFTVYAMKTTNKKKNRIEFYFLLLILSFRHRRISIDCLQLS